MAIGWRYFEHLDRQGIFDGGNKRILDIGAQNLFDIPVDPAIDFLKRHGSSLDDIALRRHVEELSRRAVWPPKKVSLFLREFLEGTSLQYLGFDIFPGQDVEIFDLNYQN